MDRNARKPLLPTFGDWLKRKTTALPLFQPASNQTEKPLPFADIQPTVEWQVNGHCNYDCTYCIQSKASRVGFPSESTINAIIGQFAELPGQWEVKMSGGEPFAFKGFVKTVIPGLINRTRHTISVLTNFSAPIPVLEKFSELTGERLLITSASLHPDASSIEDFLAKAVQYRAIRRSNNSNSSFVVNCVLVPGKIKQHIEFKDQVEGLGFRYFPQLMKIKGGVFPYPPNEVDLIEKIVAGSHDPKTVNRSPNYKGLHCESGVWYFTVDKNGQAYSCRTGKRYLDVDDRADMGNLVEGTFKLRDRGGKCPYSICPCTVPANRNIVRIGPDHQSLLASRDESEVHSPPIVKLESGSCHGD